MARIGLQAGERIWNGSGAATRSAYGSGIGSGVLRELLERCDRSGVSVRLNVLRGSPARRLYERHGFTLEAEDPVDVVMARMPARHR